MKRWTIEDLLRLDRQFAEGGVALHRRPLLAAQRILGAVTLGIGADPEAESIMNAYKERFPETVTTWPGSGFGYIASVDQVRKTVVPVVYGRAKGPLWAMLGFSSASDWWDWCRRDNEIADGTAFAFADMCDFALGVPDLTSAPIAATDLWKMAHSNLEDIGNILPSAFSVDSILQPICLVVELAVKGALTACEIRFDRGRKGHDVSRLAKQLTEAKPHGEDWLFMQVVERLPPYVESRYVPAALSRLEVVRLALGAQFVAASAVRRLGRRDASAHMAKQGKRPVLFP